MLWTNRTPKVAALALLNTFVLPWDSAFLAGVVLALAATGLFLLLFKSSDGRPVLAGDGWRRAASWPSCSGRMRFFISCSRRP